MKVWKLVWRIRPAMIVICALGMPALAVAQVAATPVPSSVTTSLNAEKPVVAHATATAPAVDMAKPVSVTAKIPAANTFKTVAAATAHCPGDIVVWSTLSKSKAYHISTSRYYGKTKHGAYVCEKDAALAGFHQAKS